MTTKITDDEMEDLIERVVDDGVLDDRDLEAVVMAKYKVGKAGAKRLIRNYWRRQSAEFARLVKSGAKFEWITSGRAKMLRAAEKAKMKVN
jgi:hypothetical protein